MIDFWKEVPGQHRAIESLSKIHKSDRIPHALLFYGTEGTGKFYTALQFAKVLNSGYPKSESIISNISELREPYVKFIMPLPRGKGETGDDGPTQKLDDDVIESITSEIKQKTVNPYHKINIEKANQIKISSIRDIRKFINLNYDDIPNRVIIISEADRMNAEAQNALLKNLEEPPSGILFILLTSEKSRLLDTIISRCWQIDFAPLSEKDLVGILTRHFGIDDEKAGKAAPFAAGSVINAIDLIENDFSVTLDKTITILRYALGKKLHTALYELNELVKDNPQKQLKYFGLLVTTWLNDTVRNKTEYEAYHNSGYTDTLDKFNQRFTKVDVNETITKINGIVTSTDMNVNLNVIMLNLIFELATLEAR